MKTKLMLGILCASLSLAAGASAQCPSVLPQPRYNAGWDAAREFCKSLDTSAAAGLLARRMDISITYEGEDCCRKGFDDYIDNNPSCAQQLENDYSGTWRRWEARRNACR
ncbi:hypothetical protein [Polyangium aurulentum]|uniref:hypothetical protein n=1 Tax=Polyangium aurulentum TaxID=2567896 RepID=UPI0010ADDE7E|nr:hypothetical protein [Polyangium aurulentum]UQA57196.1 hypothetical protein E8A73_038800 [Polyangium aurulentum]